MKNLSPQSRIWVYQSNQPFSAEAASQVKDELRIFVEKWTSHNQQLKAVGELLHNRFVVLMVDETQAGASGCSIDKSVYFLKQLQAAHKVDLFDRMRFSYRDAQGTVHTVSRDEFDQLYKDGQIQDDTIVFDTLVDTKAKFDADFEKPLHQSWHKRLVG